MLDAQQEFHVFAPEHALAGFRFAWGEPGELTFPIAQDVGLHTHQLADFTDLEVQLVGNGRSLY